MKNNETKKGYPASPQDSQKDNQLENAPSNAIIPYNDVLVKNRKLGRVKGYLERSQRIAYNVFLKVAYDSLFQDPNRSKFSISIKDFCNLTKLDYETYHSHLFTDYQGRKSIKKLLKELQTKTYEIEWRDEKDEPYRVLSASLLSQFIMDRDKDYIEFEFPSAIREAILTKQNFYILHFPIMNSMRSTYSIALYEQIAQRKEFGIWRVSAKDFRELMGVEKNKYKLTRNFHDFVLYPAVQGINEVIPIDLRVKKIKQGRSIVAYEFTWDTEKFEHEISQLYKHISNTSIIQPIIVQSTPQLEEQQAPQTQPTPQPEPQPQSEPEPQPTSQNNEQQITELQQIYSRISIEALKNAVKKYGYDKVKSALLIMRKSQDPINKPEGYLVKLLEVGIYTDLQKKVEEEQEMNKKAREKAEQERKQQALDAWWDKEIEKYISHMDETQRKMLRNEAKRVALFKYHFKSEKDIPTISIEIEEKAIIKEQLQAEGVKPPEDF